MFYRIYFHKKRVLETRRNKELLYGTVYYIYYLVGEMFGVRIQPFGSIRLDGLFNGLHVDLDPTYTVFDVRTTNFFFGFLGK